MYEYEGLQDVIFIALYCVAAFAALLTCVYLLCRRGNAFMQEKGPETLVPLTMAVLLAMLFSFRNNGQHYN